MKKSIQFAFVLHHHQPVGNFDYVLEEAYDKAYLPMLDCLERHPGIKIALHMTGPLWDFLLEEKPQFIDKLRRLVKGGQVEMLSGAYYEPILVNISDRDKITQIKKMNRSVRRETGYKPRGMWLAERVWEQGLAKNISLSEIQYTLLDEYHLRCGGLEEKDTFGYYLTEEQGYPLSVFPLNHFLRLAMPFSPVEDVMDYLEKWASADGRNLAVFGDDGEKFGLWPDTYKRVWEDGWMDELFSRIEENSSWIKMVTPSEYMDKNAPRGRIYIPTASYFEMTAWSTPVSTTGKLYDTIDRFKRENLWHERMGFFHGAPWRNFLVKYPESNRMQKKALFVSEKVSLMLTAAKEEAQNELFMGQCNCAYWHGWFGGIYLPHLRHAVQEKLIRAETIADDEKHRGEPFKEVLQLDINRDAKDEVIINTRNLSLTFVPHLGGALEELDYKQAEVNYCDTMTRRKEHYHDEIRSLHAGGGESGGHGGSMTAEQLEDLVENMVYDDYARNSFLDHFLGDRVDLNSFSRCEHQEDGDFIGKPYDIFTSSKDDKAVLTLSRKGNVTVNGEDCPVEIEKTFFVPEDGDSFQVQYWIINNSDLPLTINYGCEMDFSFLSRDMGTNFVYAGKKIEDKEGERIEIEKFPLDAPDEHAPFNRISVQDGHRQVKIHMETGEEAESLWHFPIFTVSRSESGFEKIYQSTVFMPMWKINLEPGDSWENSLEISFEDVEVEIEEEEAEEAVPVAEK